MNNSTEFRKCYVFEDKDQIGEGGQGSVYKAFDKTRHITVAVKRRITQKKGEKEPLTLQQEFDAAKSVPEHPNIAHYENVFSFNEGKNLVEYAVIQYYEEGDLSDLLKKTLSLEQRQALVRGIVEGLVHLHKHGVIHRDLKSSNVVIAHHQEQYIPKIADFGLSRQLKHSDVSNSLAHIGTTEFMAPELFEDDTKLSFKSDDWALGIVIWDIFLGETPFASQKDNSNTRRKEVQNKIIKGVLPTTISEIPEPYQNIVRRCLVKEPKERISANDVLALLPVFEEKAVDAEGVVREAPLNEKKEWTPLVTLPYDDSSISPKEKSNFWKPLSDSVKELLTSFKNLWTIFTKKISNKIHTFLNNGNSEDLTRGEKFFVIAENTRWGVFDGAGTLLLNVVWLLLAYAVFHMFIFSKFWYGVIPVTEKGDYLYGALGTSFTSRFDEPKMYYSLFSFVLLASLVTIGFYYFYFKLRKKYYDNNSAVRKLKIRTSFWSSILAAMPNYDFNYDDSKKLFFYFIIGLLPICVGLFFTISSMNTHFTDIRHSYDDHLFRERESEKESMIRVKENDTKAYVNSFISEVTKPHAAYSLSRDYNIKDFAGNYLPLANFVKGLRNGDSTLINQYLTNVQGKAQQGDKDALILLGYYHFSKWDYKEAADFYWKAYTLKSRFKAVQIKIGLGLMDEARQYLKQLASEGYQEAILYVGEDYYKKKEYANAIDWFMKMPKYHSKMEITKYKEMTSDEIDGDTPYVRTPYIRTYSSEVEYVIAECYEKMNNFVKAQVHYARAANRGHSISQNIFGIYNAEGKGGLTKNKAEADTYFQKAAKQGNYYAQKNLNKSSGFERDSYLPYNSFEKILTSQERPKYSLFSYHILPLILTQITPKRSITIPPSSETSTPELSKNSRRSSAQEATTK